MHAYITHTDDSASRQRCDRMSGVAKDLTAVLEFLNVGILKALEYIVDIYYSN